MILYKMDQKGAEKGRTTDMSDIRDTISEEEILLTESEEESGSDGTVTEPAEAAQPETDAVIYVDENAGETEPEPVEMVLEETEPEPVETEPSEPDPEEMDPEEMDPEEAAVVARILAKAMIASEFSGKTPEELGLSDHHVLSEKELLAAEAAEQAVRNSFSGRLRAAWRKTASIATPNNKRFAIPAVIAEAFILIALIFVLINYAHVAPQDPVQYTDKSEGEHITCADGLLIYNDVSAKVPTDGNLKYSVSYSWAEDDTDYPSVPTSALATYTDAPEGGKPVYEISLYKDSFTPNEAIPAGKDRSNWFSGWSEEKSEELYAFPHKVNDINGFCISNLHAENVTEGYRTYTYYFAVQENGGISVYALEGICYDPQQRDAFKEIIKESIASVKYEQKEA